MIDDDPKHVEAAYEAAMHHKKEKIEKVLYDRIEKLERENETLREKERAFIGLLNASDKSMLFLWQEIEKLQDMIDEMSEDING